MYRYCNEDELTVARYCYRANSRVASNESDLKTDLVIPEEEGDRVLDSGCNLGRRLTDSSTDLSVQSIIMKNELSCRNNGDSVSSFSSRPDHPPSATGGNEETNDDTIKISTLKRVEHVDVDEPSGTTEEQNSHREHETYNLLPLPDTDYCKTTSHTRQHTSSSEAMSLREELFHSGIPLTDGNASRGSLKKLKNVLTRCSSFEESCKENSDDESAIANENSSTEDYRCPEKAYHYADSATESEFASYSHRSLTNKVDFLQE